MRRIFAVAVASLAATAAVAQDHAMVMPGMAMPAEHPVAHAGAMQAPPAPSDHYADRRYDPAAMARAREQMMREEGGGQAFSQIMFNLAELQLHDGYAGYRWDGEAWFGGDRNRVVAKSEGEGGGVSGLETAEIQALFSRAIGPYFNLQGGVRQDIRPTPARTYATIGIEGLAPYMIETEAALFLSTHGELLARVEGWYDQRITQRLVLQPRVELNLSAQDIDATRTGAGLADAELGLRLRYELARRFAPYVGVSYEAKTGRTADYARANDEEVRGTRLVTGVRFWF